MLLNSKLPIAAALLAVSASAGLAQGDSSSALIGDVAALIASGDQARYELYAAEHYAPATLQEASAAYQASLLARIYTDTAGFDGLRVVGAASGWVQAEGRARTTGLPYCLTVTRTQGEGGDGVTGVTARDLYEAGPALGTPEPRELVARLVGLARAFERRDLFSGVILIARNGRVLFRRAYGSASPRLNIAMGTETHLNTASIGKMFTGVAIAQLVESGRLSYDATLGSVWPDFPNIRARQATLRQLLTHRSGLGPNDYYDDPRYPALVDRITTVDDYMRLAVDTPMDNAPGTFAYSNSGYIFLGALIERLSGQSFQDYVRDHIFRPAGMTDSFYARADVRGLGTASSLTNFREQPDHTYLFILGPPNEAAAMGGSVGGPQGGAWVTADDLYRFSRALREGRLIRPETFAQMAVAQSEAGVGPRGLVGEAREGLGMEVVTNNGHVFYGHTGGDFGIASLLYWYPQTGYTTVILSNRDARAARVLTNASRALITRRSLGAATPPAAHCTPPA